MLRKVEAGCVGRPEPSFDLLAPPNGSCRARALYYFYWLAPVLQASGRGGYSNFWANGYSQGPFSMSLSLQMRNRRSFASAFFLFLLLAFIPSSSGSQDQNQNPPASDTQNHSQKGKTVYVCACLKTKSCFCRTEAKMEGPCACGTGGGPPLKPVPADSDWAKQNREALAK